MITRPSLQIILARHRGDEDAQLFELAVERAFKGGAVIGGYLANGEDLGVEFRKFNEPPPPTINVNNLIDAACHSVVVVLLDKAMLDEVAMVDFVDRCWTRILGSAGRHRLVILAPDERLARSLRSLRPNLASNQAVSSEQLGELAIRPAIFSLRVIHEARTALAIGLSSSRAHSHPAGFLNLFISHAKLDGLPLAQSLKHQIKSIPFLSSFYDARDLATISDWQPALESAARSSILIILRTDAYETRPWCRQEALWAEESCAPTVLVEARPGLAYPAGELPLERMPSVRIPDGNLFRILHTALRESLRYLCFQRKVHEMCKAGVVVRKSVIQVFSYPPSMSALLRVCSNRARSKGKNKAGIILYPDPPLRMGAYEAAVSLVASMTPRVQLVTPETLAAKK